MLVTVTNKTRFIDSMCKTLRGLFQRGRGHGEGSVQHLRGSGCLLLGDPD